MNLSINTQLLLEFGLTGCSEFLFPCVRISEVTRRYPGKPDCGHQRGTGLYLKLLKLTVRMSLFVNLNFWLYMVLQVSVLWITGISLGWLTPAAGRKEGAEENKTANVRKNVIWGAFAKPLLRWKSNKYYIFWMCVSAALSYPARTAHAPCYIVICHLSGSTIFFHIIS
jgi:hypothetical protein